MPARANLNFLTFSGQYPGLGLQGLVGGVLGWWKPPHTDLPMTGMVSQGIEVSTVLHQRLASIFVYVVLRTT